MFSLPIVAGGSVPNPFDPGARWTVEQPVTFSPDARTHTSGYQKDIAITTSFTPGSGSGSAAGLEIVHTTNGTSSGKSAALAVAGKTNTLTGGSVYLFDFGTTTTDYGTGYTQVMYLKSDGSFAHVSGSGKIGFFGATPVSKPSTYTITDATPTRSMTVAALMSAEEVANTLAQLLDDLASYGLILVNG